MFFKHALEHGTFTWNTDGGWTYKAAQAGEFVYYLTCQSVYLFSNSSTSLLVYHLHLLSHRLFVDGFEDFLHEFRRHAE